MTETTLKMTIEKWDEQAYEERASGGRLATAHVKLRDDDAGVCGSFHSLLSYAADGKSSYVWLLSLDGAVLGTEGSTVLLGEGTYDATTARFQVRSALGQGTGGLGALTIKATSASTKDDYAVMPVTLIAE